jgi:hypothetical protein
MEFQPEVRQDAFGIINIYFRSLRVGPLYTVDQYRKLIRDEGVVYLKRGREKPLARKPVRP